MSTLAIFIGYPDELDDQFEKLERDKYFDMKMTPRKPWSGDALLVSGGRKGSGDLYTIVGLLHEPSVLEKEIHFTRVTRFPAPLVVVHDANSVEDKIRRTDLIGALENWGPAPFYYLPPNIQDQVVQEAGGS